ncbi:cytochrome c biogenesis protein CcdA [Candidatus Omnitrophota bacterium]
MDPYVVKVIDYFSVFGAGVIVSFTPCIYPLIPITLSVIAPKAEGSRSRGLYLSLVYVSGIAVTYSILGLIAGLTGTLFGKISSHPVSYAVIGVACIVFGLSMAEVIRLPVRQISLQRKTPKGDFISLFIFGLISGLAIGPCVFPIVSSLLLYVASKQNLILATSLLFTFAFGMGFTLVLTGTFSSLLVSLPKPGRWMLWVKRIGGLVLVGIGIYFLIKTGRMLL